MNLFLLKELAKDRASGVWEVAHSSRLGEDKFLDKLAGFVTEAEQEYNVSNVR